MGHSLYGIQPIHGQCWGLIQNDGSRVQFQGRAQSHGTIVRNWVHSSPKYGIRFDDSNPPKMGYDGTITYNVVWARETDKQYHTTLPSVGQKIEMQAVMV